MPVSRSRPELHIPGKLQVKHLDWRCTASRVFPALAIAQLARDADAERYRARIISSVMPLNDEPKADPGGWLYLTWQRPTRRRKS